MSTPLWPSPHVFFTPVQEDIIILDVDRDSYACIPDGRSWLRVDPDGSILVDDEGRAQELQSAGLAVDHPPRHPRQNPVGPTHRLEAASPARWVDVVVAAQTLGRATLLFRHKGLREILAISQSWSVLARPNASSRIGKHIAAYDSVLPWLPGEGECLQRAFQLKYLLARRGCETDWVFGVRTWPFGAHCWLQVGEAVVGDSLDRVTSYAPIMVV